MIEQLHFFITGPQKIYIPASGPKKLDRAHPMTTGSGPDGETCKSCKHCTRSESHARKRFYKCGLMRATRGSATDIRLKDPACGRWEETE